METDKQQLNVARLDDFTKLGRYSLLLCLFAEVMIFSQLGNMLYMMYAGSAPTIVSCGDHDLTHLSTKEACDHIIELQANTSCELKLEVQFESVNHEWRYLCESTKEVKNSISMQMIGVMLGSVLFGQMSDMYGRKLTMLICLFGCITFSFASSYTQNLMWFTICRFFIGIFNGGHIAVLLVFMIENLPKKHRLSINTIITWSPNMIFYAVLAYFCHDWRVLARVSSILTIPAFLLCMYMFESPRFLIQKGKIDEAKRVMMGIAKFNNEKHLDEGLLDAILDKEHQILIESSGKKHYHFLHLFYTWKFTTYTVVIAFSFMVTSVVNYGLLFNMEKVSGSIYWNSAIIGILRYIINLSAGLLDYKVQWIGRKAMHLGAFLSIVFCTLFIVAINMMGEQYDLAFYSRIAILAVSAVISQIYITNGVCTNELFPTSIRNLAYAFSQLSSRFGVVVSPQLFYLADFWTPLPYFTMSLLAALDIILFECLIPETKGHPLIDHMPGPEERIFANKKYRKVLKSDGEKMLI